MRLKPYPRDLTDAQGAILEPLLPQSRPLGRPRKTSLREVVDAILDRNRNGCTWRALPHDFPPGGPCITTSSGGGTTAPGGRSTTPSAAWSAARLVETPLPPPAASTARGSRRP